VSYKKLYIFTFPQTHGSLWKSQSFLSPINPVRIPQYSPAPLDYYPRTFALASIRKIFQA